MKKFVVLLIIAVLTLMVSSTIYAQSNAPQGVNTFTVSPAPSVAGSTVTVAINANMTSGDGTTAFCLYAPTTAVGTFPTSITLSYLSGFSTTPVVFAGVDGTATCPSRTGQSSYVYTGGAGSLPAGDQTYEGDASFAISGTAVAGTYNWTLTLQEPGSGVNPLSYSHQIIAVGTPDTGLSGRLVDSKTLSPWLYGAEIKVVQTTGVNAGVKGSTYVDPNDGTWSVIFGTTDELSACGGGGCTGGNEFATYQIFVNFTCNIETTHGTRLTISDLSQFTDNGECPVGPVIKGPGTNMTAVPVNFEVTVTDGASGAVVAVGDWETGRGPTAVSLQNVAADSNTTTAVGIGFVVMMLAGVTFVMVRRREVA